MDFSRAVIFHGKPSEERVMKPGFDPSRANFLGWLADELCKAGVCTVSPVIQNAHKPSFDAYASKLRRLTDFSIGTRPSPSGKWPKSKARRGLEVDSTLLVAHSAAAGPVLEWAQDNQFLFGGKILLVAPWVDPENRYTKMRKPRIATREVRMGRGATGSAEKRVSCFGEKVFMVSSSDDNPEALSSFEWLLEKIPDSTPVELGGFGHFVTGEKLKPDYDLGNGLVGSTCPKIMEIVRDL